MVPEGCRLEFISPAKINLSLAVLGRQSDGFHFLHSVVAQTEFGDPVSIEWDPDSKAADQVYFHHAKMDNAENTVVRAIQIFRSIAKIQHGQFKIHIDKEIPIGAGLGGGSSNAVIVIRALKQLFADGLPAVDWVEIVGQIGSDCPLFLSDQPVLMEGRGEQITPLEQSLCNRLSGCPVILFKPAFSINTAHAYSRLAKAGLYQSSDASKQLLADWRNGEKSLPGRCNDFERLLESWMPSIPIVLNRLRHIHGLDARLSGSGSACFVFPEDLYSAINNVEVELKQAWGNGFWMRQTRLK